MKYRCRKCKTDHSTNEDRIKCEAACRYQCETCEAGPGEKHKPTDEAPGDDEIAEMISDGIASATDGCTVEPDGRCPHGHSSWLIALGLI